MSEVIILIVLFILSAFFSASETAFTSLSRIKVGRMVEQKLRGAKLVSLLKENSSDFLATILIGNNLANIAASVLATSIIIRMFEENGWNMGLAVGTATGIMTLLILTFGEIIPKTIAIRKAEKFSLLVAPLIFGLSIILKPFAFIFSIISRPFILLFGGKAPEKGPFISEAEIKLILAAGEKEGVIEEEEREMITSIFEFGDTIVREVMTPRPDISTCQADQPIDALIKVIVESGHSRIPIYEGNLDNIVGVVYAKDILKYGKEVKIKEMLRTATFIPETKKVSELMHEMQAARTHLAVIVDEYGMTSGLVTLEDLVEEIVGEIHDEFERDEKMIEKLDNNNYLVVGRMAIKDLNDELKLNLPEKDVDTIGGFVFGQLGRMPSVGASIKYENIIFSVERIHRRRITRVRITKLVRDIGEEAVGG